MSSERQRGDDPCADHACGLDLVGSDRRAFLAQLGSAAAAVLVALGAGPVRAVAEPLALARAIARAGTERTYPIPAADGVSIDTENEVILVRWQHAVYAFNLACPHQNVALRWLDADGAGGTGRFQCPKHKSRYQPDGTFIEGRATRPMDRLGLRRAGEAVVVDTGALHKQPDDPAAYAAAVVRLA